MIFKHLPSPIIIATLCGFFSLSSPGAQPAPTEVEATESLILGTALGGTRAYDKLAFLTDRIGHRLSGSRGLKLAVAWSAEEFRRDGIEHVWTEEVEVPHWVRGEEHARLIEPRVAELAMLGLGGSVGTPEEGIRGEVVIVRDSESLAEMADEIRGKIVLFHRTMEPGFRSANGYGSVVRLRSQGPSQAARYGAIGMLIRSLGTADFRLPHTGALRYDPGLPKIPAAALAAEDADLIERLLAANLPVSVELKLGAQTLPDAISHNVIAEIRGRELPDEIVLIGAHLDSWDVGTGAHDDGAGCAIVMETLVLLDRLAVRPRRTIRAVLFTNEENGLRGGRDYAARHGKENHVVAIESDSGGFRPVGFGVTAGEGGVAMVQRMTERLRTIDAARITPGGGGADITPLRAIGVPVMSLRHEGRHYFDYHHTEADTLDKVDRSDLDKNVAALALLTYRLAEADETLPRLE